MAKIKKRSGSGNYLHLQFFCPACKELHQINAVVGPPVENGPWGFNGDFETPTIAPSIRVKYGKETCHSFVEGGNIRFCSDSTHAMAGKTVPLPEVNE